MEFIYEEDLNKALEQNINVDGKIIQCSRVFLKQEERDKQPHPQVASDKSHQGKAVSTNNCKTQKQKVKEILTKTKDFPTVRYRYQTLSLKVAGALVLVNVRRNLLKTILRFLPLYIQILTNFKAIGVPRSITRSREATTRIGMTRRGSAGMNGQLSKQSTGTMTLSTMVTVRKD